MTHDVLGQRRRAGVGIGSRPAVTSQWSNQEFDRAPTSLSSLTFIRASAAGEGRDFTCPL